MPGGKKRSAADAGLDTQDVADTPTKGSASGRVNPGGSSTLAWFNSLLERKDLEFVRDDLFEQLKKHSKTDPSPIDPTSPCKLYQPATNRPKTREEQKYEHPRIQPGLKTRNKLARVAPDFDNALPVKCNASHVALIKAEKKRPDGAPPRCPPDWLKSLGRLADADSKWVASHLCHQKMCVNPDHIVWEPGWYNRARDNCPGKVDCEKCHTQTRSSCSHIPQCQRAHRAAVLDWRTLSAEPSPRVTRQAGGLLSFFPGSSSSSDSALVEEQGDETQEEEDPLVYDDEGYDQYGFDKDGLDREGITREEHEEIEDAILEK